MAITKIPYGSHDEWLAIRKKYIGGSDAGAILGLNPYSSAYSVWAEKTGRTQDFEGNVTTKTGAYLEQLVADMFEEESGKKVRKCNFTLVNSDYPFACANVDRMIEGEDAILECKTTNSYVNTKKFRNGEYPEQWYCQMTHYLAVTGKKKAYLAVLSECKEFRVFELERDEAEIATLMQAEQEFWAKVTNDTPPQADGSEATSEAIKAIYKSDNGEKIDLPHLATALEERETLAAQIKKLTEQKDAIDNQIKSEIGEYAGATAGAWSISFAAQSRTTYDVKAYLAANASAPSFGPYTKISSYKTLKINKKK